MSVSAGPYLGYPDGVRVTVRAANEVQLTVTVRLECLGCFEQKVGERRPLAGLCPEAPGESEPLHSISVPGPERLLR